MCRHITISFYDFCDPMENKDKGFIELYSTFNKRNYKVDGGLILIIWQGPTHSACPWYLLIEMTPNLFIWIDNISWGRATVKYQQDILVTLLITRSWTKKFTPAKCANLDVFCDTSGSVRVTSASYWCYQHKLDDTRW